MAVAVTTRSYDNTRSNANLQESVLTADAVATHGIRRLYSLLTPGDKRGVEAQPLFVPGVGLADGSSRDVIYLATMANQVWAFDAADGTLLWERTLGGPVKGSPAIDAYLINDNWGILSTPVIDSAAGVMYVVSWISPDSSPGRAQHHVHAVSIVDGHDVHPPVSLEGVTYDPGGGLPVQQFRSAARKQRASLLLTTSGGETTVFIAFGTLVEVSDLSRGWVIACGVNPLAVTAAWASTCRGDGAGIWQAGAGLAADDQGFVYAITGNGEFDAVTDFGECFIKLKYTPHSAGATAAIAAVDWWSPYSDDGRVGLDPAGRQERTATPTNFRAFEKLEEVEWGDMDLGSGGPVLVPSKGLLVGAGKDGILYCVNQASLGKTQPGDLSAPSGNYAKLKSPPVFFTYYPPALSPAPQDIKTLNVLYGNVTHHLHGSPTYWDSPDLGPMLFCWGENGNLRAWSIAADGSVKYLACGAEVASAQVPAPGGMPGGMLTLSANAAAAHTGVVWALIPYGDANKTVSAGRLLAYDATRFGSFADGSKQLQVLWDSERWGLTFSYNKFNLPVVANGRLIVPTYDGRVDVYGL